MNKKAQALALFITIIPVIFIVIMFVYASGVFVNEKNRVLGVLDSTVEEAKRYDLSDDKIIDLLNKNSISKEDIEIVNQDEEKTIIVKVKYPVINKTYEIKTKMKEAE